MNLWIVIPLMFASAYVLLFLTVFVTDFLDGSDYREAGGLAARVANMTIGVCLGLFSIVTLFATCASGML